MSKDSTNRGFGLWPEWTAISSYAAIVAVAIAHHEPWADEAQAWQLARSLSLGDLFRHYVRYEASPGLWHFMLWILVRMHVSYSGLHWICGAIAVGATALFVFKSPFPRYLKLTLPFTFFLVFQYAIVARSYVLVPPLLYLIAMRWRKSPVVLAVFLGLLGNVSLHAAVISGGLATVFLLDKIRSGALRQAPERRRLIVAAFVLIGFSLFAIWSAWPPHDLMAHISETRLQHSDSPLMKFLVALILGICRPWYMAIPFWIAVACWLHARRSSTYLLPVLFFAAFCAAVSVGWWHAGLLIPLLICLLWITWPEQREIIEVRAIAGRIAILGVAMVQISWAAYALTYDYREAYSSAPSTAQFLKPLVAEHKTIAVTSLYDPYCDAYHAVGILPYFDHNIFVNMPDSFWLWGDRNPTEALFDAAFRGRPSVVVVEGRSLSADLTINLRDPKVDLLNRSGYKMTDMFCGALPDPSRYGLMERNCHFIFQPAH